MTREKEIMEFVDAHYEEAVALLEELGRIPAPSHQEDLRAAFCKNWFEKNSLADEVRIDEAKNVIASFGLDRYRDIAVFMAHTDIVFDDLTPLPMKREGNILFAPGIGDDTSNLVNLMMGLKYLSGQKSRLSKAVLIVANSCEEGLGNLDGCKQICRDYGDRITDFYTFDGYLGQLTSIPVGSHRYRIRVFGEGGHSYLDFGSSNAIHNAARIICALYDIQPPSQKFTSYNVGRISGGSTINSIAQEAEFLYEYRSESEECLQIMKAEMDKVFGSFRDEGIKTEISLLGVRPGLGLIDKDAYAAWTDDNIALLRESYDGELDLGAYSTDANIPLSEGIFANCIGTVAGGDAHKREEWVDLTSLPAGMRIVISFIDKYMEKGEL